ncbi:MAG: hypothetical protein K2L77_08740 [Muribaculaceae bacterium]|nr:hypothetical protein [Muribaculaceae bacterium]
MRLATILIAMISIIAIPPINAWEHIASDSYKFTYHYRVASHPGGRFGIRISDADTTAWRAITVSIPDVDIDDLFNRGEARIIFSHMTPGQKEYTDSVIRIPFTAQDGTFPRLSLRLSSFNENVTLVFGEKTPVYKTIFTIDNSQPIAFDYSHDKKTQVIRNTLRSTHYPPITHSPFADIDSLIAYTAASKDIYEGLWRYYDRSFNTFKVPDEGRYNIATVRTEEGYKIIYLSTDDNIRTRLAQLDIKGHLSESGFRDIFNLDWLDSQGWPADRYASAHFEGNLLTLRFPTLDVTMRFARVKQPEK